MRDGADPPRSAVPRFLPPNENDGTSVTLHYPCCLRFAWVNRDAKTRRAALPCHGAFAAG